MPILRVVYTVSEKENASHQDGTSSAGTPRRDSDKPRSHLGVNSTVVNSHGGTSDQNDAEMPSTSTRRETSPQPSTSGHRTGSVTNRLRVTSSDDETSGESEDGPVGQIKVFKNRKYSNADLRRYLREDGQYDDKLITEIMDTFTTGARGIHTPNTRSSVNSVLSLNTNVIDQVRNTLINVLKHHKSAVNVQIAFGKLLVAEKFGRARYFHASTHSDDAIFDQAKKITSFADIDQVIENLAKRDLLAAAQQGRENSAYKAVMLTNFIVYHTPLMVQNRTKGSLKSIKDCCIEFPEFKARDNSIVSHFSVRNHKKSARHKMYKDGLCMFRALALYFKGVRSKTQAREVIKSEDFDTLTEQYLLTFTEFKQNLHDTEVYMGKGFPTRELEELDIRRNGVSLNDIAVMEKCFDINIVLLYKGEDHQAVIYRDSCGRHDDTSSKVLYLDLYEDHVSYILDLDMYSGVYMCDKCGRVFGRVDLLKRHRQIRSNCTEFPRHKFVGGFYKRKLSIFEELEKLNIGSHVPVNDRFYPFFACFDFESMHKKTPEYESIDADIELGLNDGSATGEVKYISLQKPLSVSICSNVPGYTDAQHFVKEVSEKQLVIDMVNYLYEIQATAYEIMKGKMSDIIEEVEKLKDHFTSMASDLHHTRASHQFDDADLNEIQAELDLIDVEKASSRSTSKPRSNIDACSQNEQAGSIPNTTRSRSRPKKAAQCCPFIESEAQGEPLIDGDDDEDDDEYDEDNDCDEDSDLAFVERDPDCSNHSSLQAKPKRKLTTGKLASSFEREAVKLGRLIERIVNWSRELIVLGFNSGPYDLRLIRQHFPEALERDGQDRLNVISGGKGFMLVSNGLLKFLDVKNFLAPGTSLAKFLTQSNTQMQKGIFPYEYIDSVSVLDETVLPPPEAFCSKLRGCNSLGKDQAEIDDNYLKMQDVWKSENMTTMRDYLRWYNNLDVIPMVEACEKLRLQYNRKMIDPFKQAISSPGASMILGMKEAEKQGYTFPLINERNNDFQYKVQSNIVGGPSIVFNQVNIAGETKIRGTENICQSIEGYDANSLYPSVMRGFLPVYCWYRRRADQGFRAERMDNNLSALEKEVILFLNHDRQQAKLEPIKTKETNGGNEIVICGYKVDGLAPPDKNVEDMTPDEIEINNTIDRLDGMCITKPTVYEVNGCYFHGHSHMIKGTYRKLNESNLHDSEREKLSYQVRLLMQRQYETEIKHQRLLAAGYNVKYIWECDWQHTRRNVSYRDVMRGSEVKPFMVRKYGTRSNVVTEDVILHELACDLNEQTGEGFFGLVRCDIEVPEADLNNRKWDELAPLFVNAVISEADITDHQASLLKNLPGVDPSKPLKFEKKLLIDCVKLTGGHALLSTELLRWYIKKGLRVTRIYEVFESCVGKPFKTYIDSVVQDRINKDKAEKTLAVLEQLVQNDDFSESADCEQIKSKIADLKETIMIGERSKVDMNSFYGKMLENKIKQSNCTFKKGYIASCIEATKPGLKRHIQLDSEGEVFQVDRGKELIKFNTPTYLASFVLQGAKLQMLKFVHDFVYKWGDPEKIQACQMDTDSFYIALAGDSFIDCLREYDEHSDEEYSEYIEAFKQDYDKVIAQEKNCNLREPGLFKLEWSGKRMVCVSSKTYAGDGGGEEGLKPKVSAKGVQSFLNQSIMNVDTFLKAQREGGVVKAVTSGFKMSNHCIGKGRFADDESEMSTYKGTKIGINGTNMLKRKLFSDGSTVPYKRAFQVEPVDRYPSNA